MRRAGAALALLALLACDAPATPTDAGLPDAGGPFERPTPPTAPAPPCPDSWLDCAPPPLTACPAGEVRFADGCRALQRCPDGDWPDPLPEASAHLFVRGGETGGDGTRERPLGTIGDAIRRAPVGAAVVVAPGTYDERLDVFGGVTVVGACAARTVIAPSGSAESAVSIGELNVGLASLTVRPAAPMVGVEIRSLGATLRDVIVEGARGAGVAVIGGELSAERLVVRDTSDVEGELGFGLAVERAEAHVEDAWLEGNAGAGVIASLDASLLVERAFLRANGTEASDAHCVAQDGARLELRAAVIGDGVSGAGFGIGGGAVLRLVDSYVGDLRPHPSGSGGTFTTVEGAHLELSRVRITDTVGYAIGTTGAGTEALVEDVAIGPIARGPNGDATGLATGQGAATTARRVSIEGAASVGVLAGGPGRLDVEDLSVASVGDGGEGLGSLGVGLGGGIVARLLRVAVSDTERAGVLVSGETTDATIGDLSVVDMRPAPGGTFGRALELQGRVTLSRVRVERALETAILTIGGGQLDLVDAVIVETRARACAETSCADSPGGTGIGAIGVARVDARRFRVEGARLCGAQVALEASLDLRDGEIRGATVGACVQVAGYDLERVTDGVVFRDNDINVDSTDHALPEASAPLPSF